MALDEHTTPMDNHISSMEKIAQGFAVGWLLQLGQHHARDRPPCQELLLLSKTSVAEIAQDDLKKHSGAADDVDYILLRIAETCAAEAVRPGGKLHTPSWPPGTLKQLTEEGNGEHIQKEWAELWLDIVEACPNGPTLFRPGSNQTFNLDNIPPVLFRTFDTKSTGTHTRDQFTSQAATAKNLPKPKSILKMGYSPAARMLHARLDSKFMPHANDNLVSWTSSLLVAIQYAIYRCHNQCERRGNSSTVMICAIRTSDFPRGQFMQDLELIDAYREMGGEEGRRFFNFRRDSQKYYNGEFLSQGVVRHSGRSAVASLHDLERAGLYDLYPKLQEPEGHNQWAKRLVVLREQWNVRSFQTTREIQCAFKIARECFAELGNVDIIAIILLSFRDGTQGIIRTRYNYDPNHWAAKPEEVTRYVSELNASKIRKDGSRKSSERKGSDVGPSVVYGSVQTAARTATEIRNARRDQMAPQMAVAIDVDSERLDQATRLIKGLKLDN